MGKLKAGSITEIQKKKIAELEGKEKLTAKQQEALDGLKAKRDAKPELPEGAKTYCKMWLKEQLYGRRKETGNKYTERGNISEDDSIALIGRHIGNPLLFKNEETFENDFAIGTPDIIIDDMDMVIDAKSSWDFSTFPLFKDKLTADYEWQLDIYLSLTGKKNGAVIYCLNNLPEKLLEDEIRRAVYNGMDIEEAQEKTRAYHTYDGLPENLRVKSYKVTYDQNRIDSVRRRVSMCREYIEELKNNLT
jgi:hypothetical protein